MSDVSEAKYAELWTRYREASMLADKYELIAKTHQDVNHSLRETNEDLRRILHEEDEKSDALNDENYNLRELLSETWTRLQMAEDMGADGVIDARLRQRIQDALGDGGE